MKSVYLIELLFEDGSLRKTVQSVFSSRKAASLFAKDCCLFKTNIKKVPLITSSMYLSMKIGTQFVMQRKKTKP